jgi:quercetin dioxygenase-like cupin family protein
MALHHAASGEIINLKNPNQNVPDDVSTALFKTDDVEVIRRVLQPKQVIPQHEVNGDMTLQCLSGKVRIKVHDQAQIMSEGELMYISACEPYSLEGEEDSIVLMTIVRNRE